MGTTDLHGLTRIRMPGGLKALAGTLVLLCCFIYVGFGAEPSLVTWQGETMGSTYTVKIVGARLGEKEVDVLKAEVDARLKEVNRQMSHYQPDSELSQFNQAPANQAFKISPEFARLLRLALEMNKRSRGAFDPTLGPVINLWGFGEKTDLRQVPPEGDLQAAFKNTGCRHLSLSEKNELTKDIPGLQINLSAIAKGFGVDEMSRVLRARGFTNTYCSISGETYVNGRNASGSKWQIGVSAPISNWVPGDPLAAILSLSGQAVSTSGDYQKFFLDDQGRRLSHIFDPRTGHPVQHNLGSVSVVADSCALADALSTTLFVLGAEQGKAFIETYTNAAALFIVREPDGKFRQIASSRFTSLTGYKP